MSQTTQELNKKTPYFTAILFGIVLLLEIKLLLVGFKDPTMWISVLISSFQIISVALATAYCIKKSN